MTQKELISVPRGVRFITEWPEFGNYDLHGHVIVNKKYTGCGMTSYYLWNNMPVILAAPRKMLLKDKMKQQEANQPTLFFYEIPDNYAANIHQVLKSKMTEYINNQMCLGQPPKILVTYKSFSKACDKLLGLGIPFQVVVDEFHVITQEIEMDSENTISFLRYLKQLPDVLYLTATPESEQDLSHISDFQDMRYVELEWPNIKTATIRPIPMTSTIEACTRVINWYRTNGYFEKKGYEYSTEAVFYINDVADIMTIIKKNRLLPEETNILVSTSDRKNLSKLTNLCTDTGNTYTMGSIPKKGEAHKTFTFCSRVVFLGCDFYSTNAYTYVFADANRNNRRIDIALDLPQIMGRQRREDNVFRDEAILFVKTTSLRNLQSREEYEAERDLKIAISQRDSSGWNNLDPPLRINIKVGNEDRNYIVKYTDINGEYKFECNDIRILSDEKAWREKNKYYRSTGTITMNLFDSAFNVQQQTNQPLLDFYNEFMQLGSWKNRMKKYCEFLENYPEYQEAVRSLTWIPEEFHDYFSKLGPDAIKAKSFQQSKINLSCESLNKHEALKEKFLEVFHIGDRIANSEAKVKIGQIYDELGISDSPKATDLKQFFKVRETSVIGIDKYDHGYKITGIRDD